MLRTAILGKTLVLTTSLAILLGSQQSHACTAINRCQTISARAAYCAAPGTTFNLTAPTDCLVIAGPNITFTANSLVINGPVFPPGGTGIHILASASGAVVTLTGATNIGGTFATQALATGIQDDASNTTLNLQGYVDAAFNPAGGSGWGIFLNNVNNTNIQLSPGPAGDTAVNGDTYGLFIVGGSHNSVVSGFDTFGDGGPAGVIIGSTDGILVRNSNHNQINHVGATGGPDGILLDNSPGNLVYNTLVQSSTYGIRVTWNSPNNFIEKNLVISGQIDLFQGTQQSTVGCNGDYWANNIGHDASGNPATNTFNQPCIGQQQSLSKY